MRIFYEICISIFRRRKHWARQVLAWLKRSETATDGEGQDSDRLARCLRLPLRTLQQTVSVSLDAASTAQIRRRDKSPFNRSYLRYPIRSISEDGRQPRGVPDVKALIDFPIRTTDPSARSSWWLCHVSHFGLRTRQDLTSQVDL